MFLFRKAALIAAVFLLPALAHADSPFDGKSLSGWKAKHPDKGKWVVGTAVAEGNKLAVKEGGSDLVNVQPGSDLFTGEKYGDVTVEVEFMVPKSSNSGIYLMGEYEVQILDSYGKANDKLTQGDLGALYSAAAPKVNAAKAPGEWQKFVIEFQAPRFEGDKKVANAKFLKVVLNGEVIHENVEMKGPTPSGVTGKEAPTGPVMFQGDHGPVSFRNIKVTPRDGK
jgi:3-keto-disaccharide hydrolase